MKVSLSCCWARTPPSADGELRKLIERVDFIPLAGLGKFQLEVHGSLAVLLGLGGTRKAKNPTAGGHGVSVDQSLTSGCEVMLGCGSLYRPP